MMFGYRGDEPQSSTRKLQHLGRLSAGTSCASAPSMFAAPGIATVASAIGPAALCTPGLYGLAPEWASKSSPASLQRWIDDCLTVHAATADSQSSMPLRSKHTCGVRTSDISAHDSLQPAAFARNSLDLTEIGVLDASQAGD
jgi:hypothetical protein